MTTRMLRRGLPRVPGGEAWPPADAVETVEPAVATPDVVVAESVVVAPAAEVAESAAPAAVPAAEPTPTGSSAIRRGLPRVPGGEPWPPVDVALDAAAPKAAAHAVAPAPVVDTASAPSAASVSAASAPAPVPVAAAAPSATAGGIRRGLPRTAGGEPWPPAGTVPVAPPDVPFTAVVTSAVEGPASAVVPVSASAVAAPAVADVNTPLPWTRTVWNGTAPRHVAPAAASARRRPTWTQAIAALMGAAALGVLAGAAVAFVRTLLSMPFMQDFLAAFPGEYQSAIAVEPGFAPWIGWQHFFNMFLMVLIIRSGLGVRTEKRPTVFWTPRGNGKGKISLTLWFHQSLDLLWIINGVIFVVLLFVTGHWVRIVPTSWEVFPNALSAGLQYVSFDWPHENGWNNYNSLQQLAYFTTVFIAAPLAAVTGFRMSGLWPQRAEKLSKAYPVEWARALHFPIMLYFVVFIIGHVALVMLTGFQANLNHMFAAQQAAGWTGFWVFIAALAVIAAAWWAARPLVLAPIAKLFGQVSGR